MGNQCKILISYHKQDYLLKDEILTPIHAGRANVRTAVHTPGLDWLLENTIGDDTGDNISEKNDSYNEMTSVYWAWKNYDRLGDPDWIGFMHYRRHFYFIGGEKPCYDNEYIGPEYLEQIGYSPENLKALLAGADFLSVKPQQRASVYEHFRENHNIEDLDRVVRILKEKYPEYAQAADSYLHGRDAYFCNMFIFPKDIFFRYASWLFDILFSFENETDMTGKRMYISERLTGIFIQKLIQEGKRGIFLPMVYAESDHVIPVVMAADENYVIPLSVAIASILCNAKPQTKYDIHLLVPNEFSAVSKMLLQRYEQIYPGCKINFLVVKDLFDDVQMSISHITKVTYYRLLIPSLLPQYDKCIYLDADLVVNTDLSGFYRTNIADFYLAGVKAAGYMYPAWKIDFETTRLNLPSVDRYINAGVLLMNLKRMRNEGLQEVFLELAQKQLQSQDQDVLNIACYNNIKIMPPVYNLMNKYVRSEKGKYSFNDTGKYAYPQVEQTSALARPHIVHFADKQKPWNNPNCILGEHWWKYVPYSTFYFEQLHLATAHKNIETLRQAQQNLQKAQQDLHKAQQDLRKAQQENHKMRQDLRATRKKAVSLNRQLRDARKSASFRVGRMVTYIPRKLRSFLHCCRDHGFFYTAKYTANKIARILKK